VRSVDAHSGIEVIDHDECVRLLADDCIGRLAVIAAGEAAIFPVNYALDGEAVVFRTGGGSKLAFGPRAPAAFEIDGFDRETRSGWSVVANGRLEEVTQFDASTYERVAALRVDPWAPGERSHWLRLVPSRITGRRVGTSGTD
jgi:nitroimidazol reductase NimA-like FMN-containing flavoprotein (pyridoxamine 5'-phosphate oxidase superfamily)